MSLFNELEKFELGKELLKKIANIPNSEQTIAGLKTTHMGPNASCNLTILQCKKGHVRFDINTVYREPTQCLQCSNELGLNNRNVSRIDSARVKTLEFLVKLQSGDWKEYLKSKEILGKPTYFVKKEFGESEWYRFFKEWVVPLINIDEKVIDSYLEGDLDES